MTQIGNVSSYAGPLSPKQKEELLMAYCDYVSYIALLTDFVQIQKVQTLAFYEVQNVYGKIGGNPWSLEEIEPKAKQAYQDFVSHENKIENNNLCFVSAIYTQTNSNLDEANKVLASPQHYTRHVHSNQLPCRVERFVACCPTNTLLKDAKFIINGKYQIYYEDAPEDMTVEEMFNNETLEKQFSCLIDTIAQFPDKLNTITDKEARDKQIETMASSLTAPIEEGVLATLTILAETGQNAIKDIIHHSGDEFLYKAEQKGIIPSASKYQDYLNIRNLAHHQLGSLDYLSCFNANETEKNISLRKRYMESYLSLCGGTLQDRIVKYQETVGDFHNLISELAPNIFIRGEKESNSKFTDRIRKYKLEHPDEKLFIETNYLSNKNKRDTLIKQIHKIVPNVQIIDETIPDQDAFIARMSAFTYRKKYLELFEHAEYGLLRHFLFRGKNYIPNVAWQQALKQKIISLEDAKKWSELKKLRNDISHKFFTKELAQKVVEYSESLFQHSLKLDKKLRELQPRVYSIGNNTFEFQHKDGINVVVDFDNKKILSATDARGNDILEKERKPQVSHKPFVEEHKNGISFKVKGNDITSMRTPNGCKINLQTTNITQSGGVFISFKSQPLKSMQLGNIKITFDDKLRIDNLMRGTRSESVGKSEIITLSGSHRITTGRNKELTKYCWIDEAGKQQFISFTTNNDGEIIANSSDGTIIKIKDKECSIFCKGMKLSYQNRAKFVNNYNNDDAPQNNNDGNDR